MCVRSHPSQRDRRGNVCYILHFSFTFLTIVHVLDVVIAEMTTSISAITTAITKSFIDD